MLVQSYPGMLYSYYKNMMKMCICWEGEEKRLYNNINGMIWFLEKKNYVQAQGEKSEEKQTTY